MEKKQNFPSHTGLSGRMLIASLFIISGMLLLARNVGWITSDVFDIVVSWQSLLIILGIYTMIRRHYITGVVLALTGVYFLVGGLAWLPQNSQAVVWPIALILVGVLFFVKARSKERRMDKNMHRPYRNWAKGRGGHIHEGMNTTEQQCESDDGYLRSDNRFGSVRHVVLDEVFRGACLWTSFGGTTIDLRHTHLSPGETYIDIDCNWGGIELFIPADWMVVTKCNAFFGGCEDKRLQGANVDKVSTLVIRGNICFGGLEVKD